MMATQEFVVPRSIPITLAICVYLFLRRCMWSADPLRPPAPIPILTEVARPIALLGVYKEGVWGLQAPVMREKRRNAVIDRGLNHFRRRRPAPDADRWRGGGLPGLARPRATGGAGRGPARRDPRRAAVLADHPLGKPMSVQMTSAGRYGWFSDRARLSLRSPPSLGPAWPPIPERRAGDLAALVGGGAAARLLPRQPLPRRREDGPAPGPRRGRFHLAGGVGLAGRRGAVPDRRHHARRPDPEPLAALGRRAGAGRRRRGWPITASTGPRPAARPCCRGAGGST